MMIWTWKLKRAYPEDRQPIMVNPPDIDFAAEDYLMKAVDLTPEDHLLADAQLKALLETGACILVIVSSCLEPWERLQGPQGQGPPTKKRFPLSRRREKEVAEEGSLRLPTKLPKLPKPQNPKQRQKRRKKMPKTQNRKQREKRRPEPSPRRWTTTPPRRRITRSSLQK